ncbi:putative HTH-type transcriptional regulator [Streptomyces sp. YIM 130001]|uniref:TetR/AcrR family transcriptional regulator n=1 Tax=Streptomyces sp. YIM 130001 TaxID=2259644 RepID=UPI000E65D120|nr:TetR/AcrR family transcriptional regulator [Streptomyces sp. YIM 130001]RII15335.1 putative HTH-type transcriptional regulator [Streptomyces sp. YIM 130001]
MRAGVSSPRERYRAQTRSEIKEAAVRQLAAGGVESVALLRIAKEIGMSGPALYRYFASRDDLLAELVLDAYRGAAQAVHAVDTSARGRTALQALTRAYRAWAVAHPHLYLLIQGTPVAGFTAPAETLSQARAVLGPFLTVFAEGHPPAAVEPLLAQLRTWLADEPEVATWVGEWTDRSASDPAAAVALTGAMMAWPQMHGTVSLEVAGQFAGMGHESGALLDVQTGLLADTFRLN